MITMTDRLELDLDNDPETPADVIIEKTNGHTVYINSKSLIKIVSGVIAAIAGILGVYVSV